MAALAQLPISAPRDDQIYDYILDQKVYRKLSPSKIPRLAQAFLGLEQMDSDFTAIPAPDQPALGQQPAPAMVAGA